jgi:hypothetical protein
LKLFFTEDCNIETNKRGRQQCFFETRNFDIVDSRLERLCLCSRTKQRHASDHKLDFFNYFVQDKGIETTNTKINLIVMLLIIDQQPLLLLNHIAGK